jgi:hypothetical protein
MDLLRIKRKPTASHMQDISSQEEDLMRQNTRHNNNNDNNNNYKTTAPLKTKNMANTGNLPPPVDLSSLTIYTKMPLDQMPIIQSLQQLVLQYPHMQSNAITGQPNCIEACNKFTDDMKASGHEVQLVEHTNNNTNKPNKKQLVDELKLSTHDTDAKKIKERHKELSNIIPWQLAAFTEKINLLPVPNWYFNDSTMDNKQLMEQNQKNQDTINSLLRKGVYELPLQTTVIENELLTEAGEWPHAKRPNDAKYFFPACCLNLKCIGQSTEIIGKLKGLTSPIKFTQVMYVEEYQKLLQTNSTAHIPPRPCVLCCRYLLGDWVTFLRANSMEGKNSIQKIHYGFEYKSQQVHQFYRNPQDCVKGYAKQFMLAAKPKEPIIESIVTLNLSLLECKLHPATGRRYIDQSALFYQPIPIPKPKIGENLQNF